MPRSVPASNPDYTGELRQRLRAHGISLGVLAKAMKIDRSQLSRLFNTAMQPNWRTVVRIETAMETLTSGKNAPPPGSGRGYTGSAIDENNELTELRKYVTAFRELIDLHDRTPAQWRHFQTEWLWLYARGMAAGEAADVIRERRVSELKGDKRPEIKPRDSRTVEYVKLEMFGGPADGQIRFAKTPVDELVTVSARTLNGRTTRVSYRIGAVSDDKTALVRLTGDIAADLSVLNKAFVGKKAVRCVFVATRRRKSRP